jgi:hypothetical protein
MVAATGGITVTTAGSGFGAAHEDKSSPIVARSKEKIRIYR